ncbi:MAG: ferrochelatase [Bacteroidota bacterium]
MTPREYLARYRDDERLATGAFFDQAPLAVRRGETVGVVLMNHGGPLAPADVASFLYNRLMDPAAFRFKMPASVRHRFARLMARRRAKQIGRAYEMIGGEGPVVRHAREQARELERVLNERYARAMGVRFRTFVAMRYGHPTCESAAAAMKESGVDRVVLLSLHPHFSTTTTGTSLAFWKAMEDAGEIASRPTTFVYEYAAHPKYIQALSERIDEGLQRFPTPLRDRVQIIFTAHGAPLYALKQLRDPYCGLVHATVQQVAEVRSASPDSLRVSFHSVGVPGRGLGPTTGDTIEELADDGHEAVLVVPITFTSDHVETAYGLDVIQRARAVTAGIEHYEVARGLNCHSLFIEALAEVTAIQVHPESHGDGAVNRPGRRTVHCQSCDGDVEVTDWTTAQPVPALARPTTA